MNNPIAEAAALNTTAIIHLSATWQDIWDYLKPYDRRPRAAYQHRHLCKIGLEASFLVIHFEKMLFLLPDIPKVPPETEPEKFYELVAELDDWTNAVIRDELHRAGLAIHDCASIKAPDHSLILFERRRDA